MHPRTDNAPLRFIHEPTLFFAAAVVTSLLIVAIYFILAAQGITNEHFVTTEAPVFEWFSALRLAENIPVCLIAYGLFLASRALEKYALVALGLLCVSLLTFHLFPMDIFSLIPSGPILSMLSDVHRTLYDLLPEGLPLWVRRLTWQIALLVLLVPYLSRGTASLPRQGAVAALALVALNGVISMLDDDSLSHMMDAYLWKPLELGAPFLFGLALLLHFRREHRAIPQWPVYASPTLQRPTPPFRFADYLKFSGQMSRKHLIGFLFLSGFLTLIFGLTLEEAARNGGDVRFIGYLYMSWLLFIGFVGLCVQAQRLHDTGRSGWYQLLSLIPFVGQPLLLWLLLRRSLDAQCSQPVSDQLLQCCRSRAEEGDPTMINGLAQWYYRQGDHTQAAAYALALIAYDEPRDGIIDFLENDWKLDRGTLRKACELQPDLGLPKYYTGGIS